MNKRMFQILDEMNIKDGKKGTETVEIAYTLVSGKIVKAGGQITMGVPRESFKKVTLHPDDYAVIMLIIDRKEYERINNQP